MFPPEADQPSAESPSESMPARRAFWRGTMRVTVWSSPVTTNHDGINIPMPARFSLNLAEELS